MLQPTYTWDNLTWKERKAGVRVAHLALYPAETLQIEVGWEITGPQRVTISHREGDKHTKVRYGKLRKSEFDLDNPLEYPCKSCGSDRFVACDEACIVAPFRVFLVEGGVL